MKPREIKGVTFDPERSYVDEAIPLTEADWNKYLEVFRQHRLSRSELHGVWLSETREERELHELAETHHTRCDAYDSRVCTGTSPRTGEAIPLSPDETRLVNRHALTMRNTVIEQGRRMGYTEEQVVQAIRDCV